MLFSNFHCLFPVTRFQDLVSVPCEESADKPHRLRSLCQMRRPQLGPRSFKLLFQRGIFQ